MGIVRKRSFKKSFKARTTGKLKRSVKKAVNPFYGKKGIGFIKNPSKSIKNAVYKRTTVGVPATGLSSAEPAKIVPDSTKQVQYVRNQKGHSVIMTFLFGWTTLYILPIYWLVSPNHYYHI